MQRVIGRCCSISLYAVVWGTRLEIIDEVKAYSAHGQLAETSTKVG